VGSEQRPADAESKSPRTPLRRADQACAAAVLVIALAAMALTWLYRGGPRGGLIEIDRAPRREVDFKVDLNTADWPELALLPGVGRTLAQRIVASRELDGPFQRPEDLRRVKGIGPKTLARMTPYLLPIEQAAE
jgi:competence protein ComEA